MNYVKKNKIKGELNAKYLNFNTEFQTFNYREEERRRDSDHHNSRSRNECKSLDKTDKSRRESRDRLEIENDKIVEIDI